MRQHPTGSGGACASFFFAPAPTAVWTGLAAVLTSLLVGCASTPDPQGQSPAATATASAPVAVPAPQADAVRPPVPPSMVAPAVAAAATAAPSDPAAELGLPFSTRDAHFEPTPFHALPQWGAGLQESLQAFRQSCSALSKRAVWQELCPRAQRLDGRDEPALRRFFEENFFAYAVRDSDRAEEGVITGYYEPLLQGSRQRSGRFAYPVYGVPTDLLFLDSRQVRDGQQVWLRLNGRQLVPAAEGSAGASLYAIRMGGMAAGVRDRRFRVRIAQHGGEQQVVPYWSRQQIEQQGLDAQVLAWVDNAFALYSMQIQGAGKIALADSGEIVRVAYGEQNGHPFLPQASRNDSASVSTAVKTRGLYAGAAAASTAGAAPVAAAPDDEVARIIAALGGGAAPAAPLPPVPASAPRPTAVASAPAAPRPAAATHSSDPEVNAMIAALLGQGPAVTIQTGSASAAAPAVATAAALAPAGTAVAGSPTGIPDPSFVFFRRIPDGPHGPLGALGVPLTAGHSIAVDPRTTPLGFPVYLATTHRASGSTINRLVFAQDTGGAIRGTIRADYYWGSGADAGRQAASMKAPGRMWLLVPRGLEVSALSTMRTRSGPAAGLLPECVWADEEFCTEAW